MSTVCFYCLIFLPIAVLCNNISTKPISLVKLTCQTAAGRVRDGGFHIDEKECDVMIVPEIFAFCKDRLHNCDVSMYQTNATSTSSKCKSDSDSDKESSITNVCKLFSLSTSL